MKIRNVMQIYQRLLEYQASSFKILVSLKCGHIGRCNSRHSSACLDWPNALSIPAWCGLCSRIQAKAADPPDQDEQERLRFSRISFETRYLVCAIAIVPEGRSNAAHASRKNAFYAEPPCRALKWVMSSNDPWFKPGILHSSCLQTLLSLGHVNCLFTGSQVGRMNKIYVLEQPVQRKASPSGLLSMWLFFAM